MVKQRFLREHDMDEDEEYFRVNKKNKSKERRYERALKTGDVEFLTSYDDEDEYLEYDNRY